MIFQEFLLYALAENPYYPCFYYNTPPPHPTHTTKRIYYYRLPGELNTLHSRYVSCNQIRQSCKGLVILWICVPLTNNPTRPFLCSGFVRGSAIISTTKEDIKMHHKSPHLINKNIVDLHFRTTGRGIEQGNAQQNIVVFNVILNDVQARC